VLRMERGDPSGSKALLICNFGLDNATLDEHGDAALQTKRSLEGTITGHSAILFIGRE
jgi:hypothetical protein